MHKKYFLTYALLLFAAIISFGQHDQSRLDKKAEDYYNKGFNILQNSTYAAITQEKAKEVIGYANKAIQINPKVSKYYRIKGSAYLYLRDYESALPFLDKAIELDSNSFIAWMDKGIANENLSRFEIAEKSYLKALSLDDKAVTLYYNMGTLYLKWKKFDNAILYFQLAINLKPTMTGSYINRGEVYILLKQYEKAIEDFDMVISLDSLNKLAYNNRGFCKIFLEKYESAIIDFEKSLSINAGKAFNQNYSTDKYCYNNIANSYLGLGKTELACKYWKLALEKGYVYQKKWKEDYNIDDPAELIRLHCE